MLENSVTFTFNASELTLQCNSDQTLKEIFERYSTKIEKDLSDIYFVYGGQTIKDQNQTLSSLNNFNNTTSILVYPYDFGHRELKKKKSKHIICPQCYHSSIINIKNYKLILSDCEKKHKSIKLKINEFENTQFLNESIIKCDGDECENIKSKTFNNQFYKCFDCGKKLCPLCKTKHDKNHKIVLDYDLIDFFCNSHLNEKFICFCKNCNKNLCLLCKIQHLNLNHEIIDFDKMIIELNENNLEEKIEILKKNVEEIISKLNQVLENLEKYKNIYNDIKKDMENRNYQLLKSILNFEQFNNQFLFKDIDDINNIDDIKKKFNYIMNIYDRMNDEDNASIKIIYKTKKNKQYIKIFGEDFVNNNIGKCNIAINYNEYELSEKLKYKDFNINTDNPYFELKLTGIDNITNMSFIFKDCESLYSIPDLNKWDTSKITDMNNLFFYCTSLNSLPDISNWDTKNVKNMSWMFCGCTSLKNIPNISKWNVSNVKSMKGMFFDCKKLVELPDISLWDMRNVDDLSGMFKYCTSLESIPDISKWNVKSDVDTKDMFYNCKMSLSIPDKFKLKL